jgi:hypothetical protein
MLILETTKHNVLRHMRELARINQTGELTVGRYGHLVGAGGERLQRVDVDPRKIKLQCFAAFARVDPARINEAGELIVGRHGHLMGAGGGRLQRVDVDPKEIINHNVLRHLRELTRPGSIRPLN